MKMLSVGMCGAALEQFIETWNFNLGSNYDTKLNLTYLFFYCVFAAMVLAKNMHGTRGYSSRKEDLEDKSL